MQLLYVANRYEWKTRDRAASANDGTILICDRYLASSVAYGEAQGLDAAWLLEIQRYLPQPDLTFLLDIAPEVSARRKTADRDRTSAIWRCSVASATATSGRPRNGWVRLSADRDRARSRRTSGPLSTDVCRAGLSAHGSRADPPTA